MGRRAALAVLLVVAAVAAGCETALTDVSRDRTATATPTPSESDASATASDRSVSPPSGLSADGVTDPELLAQAHRRVLSQRSYAMEYTKVARTENGTVLGRTSSRARVTENTTRFSYVLTMAGVFRDPYDNEDRRQRIWGNDSTLVYSQTSANETVYGRFSPTVRSDVERIATGTGILKFAFVLVDTRVVDVGRRDGTVLYRIESTDGPHALDARNVSLSATVEASGVVRSLTLRYRTDQFGEHTEVVRRLRFGGFNETTVPRPEWIDRGLEDGA